MGISGNSTVLPNQINRLSGFNGSFRNAVGRINLSIYCVEDFRRWTLFEGESGPEKKISTVF